MVLRKISNSGLDFRGADVKKTDKIGARDRRPMSVLTYKTMIIIKNVVFRGCKKIRQRVQSRCRNCLACCSSGNFFPDAIRLSISARALALSPDLANATAW